MYLAEGAVAAKLSGRIEVVSRTLSRTKDPQKESSSSLLGRRRSHWASLSPSPLQCHNNSTRQPILPLQGMFLTGVILPNRECLHRAAESSIRDLNEASLGYAAILHSRVDHDPPNRIDGHLRSLGCCVIAPLPHFDTAGRHAKQGTLFNSLAWL